MTVVTFLLLVYGLIVALLVVSIMVTAGRRLTNHRRLRLVSRRPAGARLKAADGRTVGRLVARAIRRRAEDTTGEC